MQSASVLRIPRAPTRGLTIPGISEAWAILTGSLALYLATAVELVLVRHAVVPNALSRVASAYFVLYSRDPHLAAIGFVRNPLPALLTLPLLPLKGLFPALTLLGFAASIVSAVCMAGAAYQLNRILFDAHVSVRLRLLLTILFAAQPALIYSGAVGSSEPILLFFLLLATRELTQWLRNFQLLALAKAGFALAAAYLAGPEALMAAAGAVLLVGIVSFRRASREPWATAACDVAVIGGPLLAALVAWLGATWLITGDPFQQLSSVYGNGSEIQALQSPGSQPGLGSTALVSGTRLLLIAPGLLIALVIAVMALRRRREPLLVASAGQLFPVLLAMFVAQVTGLVLTSVEGFIVAVPVTVLASAGVATALSRRWASLARATAVGFLVLSFPTAIALQSMSPVPLNAPAELSTAATIARYMDARHLPNGSVLLDSFSGFPIVLESQDPRQFLITNDRDFRLALTDPAGSGVQYVLVPASPIRSTLASLDALNRAYPTLYRTGAGMATLVREFRTRAGASTWRLYQLNPG